jgi:hypothetical protein
VSWGVSGVIVIIIIIIIIIIITCEAAPPFLELAAIGHLDVRGRGRHLFHIVGVLQAS